MLQRAVLMVLEAVYEQDFLPCSYGFRPGRSAHGALRALRDGVMDLGGGYVLEADIRDCFGTLSHEHLRRILHQRIRDGVLTRLIDKWLKAGVLENGSVTRPQSGSPQGGVISPMLANVYLHSVLDTWFEGTVKPHLRGRAFLVRYADDFVIVFTRRDDAERVYREIPGRFSDFGLTLHPEKTRLLAFEKPRQQGPLSRLTLAGPRVSRAVGRITSRELTRARPRGGQARLIRRKGAQAQVSRAHPWRHGGLRLGSGADPLLSEVWRSGGAAPPRNRHGNQLHADHCPAIVSRVRAPACRRPPGPGGRGVSPTRIADRGVRVTPWS